MSRIESEHNFLNYFQMLLISLSALRCVRPLPKADNDVMAGTMHTVFKWAGLTRAIALSSMMYL